MTYTKLLLGGVCGGVLGAGVSACAGEKLPFHSESDDRAIAAAYAGSASLPPGNGGSSGDGGSAGSANQAGSGGAGPGNGGSSGSGNNGGSGNLPSGGSSGSANADVCNAPEVVFSGTCGGGDTFCHGEDSSNGDFALSAAAAEALLDAPSSSGQNCGLFIDSGDIDESLILTKVTDEFNRDACGQSLMPLGATEPLPQDQIDCIESWLSQFAE